MQDDNRDFPAGDVHYNACSYSYYMTDNSRGLEQAEVNDHVQNQLLSINSMEDLKECPELYLLWEKTMMLLHRGRILQRATQKPGLVVYDVVCAGLPSIVAWFADKLYPNTLGTRDSQGFLPLHHAIREMVNNDLRVVFGGNLSIANGSMYKFLVSAFPEAAQYLDVNGRLPLTFLLHEKTVCLDDAETLMKAEPRALITRDIKTAYYPFMTAAGRERFKTYYGHRGKSKEGLSLVYMLLRANPLAISSGIKENDHEIYLKKKLAMAESKVTRLEKENATLAAENKKLRSELQSSKNEASAGKRSASTGPPADGAKKARVMHQAYSNRTPSI